MRLRAEIKLDRELYAEELEVLEESDEEAIEKLLSDMKKEMVEMLLNYAGCKLEDIKKAEITILEDE